MLRLCVLIIHQTLVSTCCVPGIIPGKAIIVVIAFERTRSYISYFLCLSLKQRVPRFVAGAACSSADASQMGCRSGHTPVPAGPAEGPAGPEQSPQPLWGQRGRPWPCCLVFSCRVGPAPFPLCLGHPQREGDPVREPRRSGVRPAHHTGVEPTWTPASRVGRELFTRLLLFLHSISLSPPDAWAGLALDSAGIEGLLVGTCRPTEGPSACGWVASRPEQRRQEHGKWRLRRTGRQGAGDACVARGSALLLSSYGRGI